jgi:hypothetical protein
MLYINAMVRSSSSSDGRVRRGNKKLPIRLVLGVSDNFFHTERRSSVAAQIVGNLFQERVRWSSKFGLDVDLVFVQHGVHG